MYMYFVHTLRNQEHRHVWMCLQALKGKVHFSGSAISPSTCPSWGGGGYWDVLLLRFVKDEPSKLSRG